MKLIFMGTPDFALNSLQKLIESKHTIQAVFTQPDKPKGRSYKLTPPPVKALAQKHGLQVYQPDSLKNDEVVDLVRSFSPDAIIVVAYGKILPKAILDIPRFGSINVHGSLLPKYRGAAPIQWSVLNGDKVTGVTTMYVAEGLDTGDIILKNETEIGENETSSELFKRIAELGGDLLIETLDQVEKGTAPRIPQNESNSCYAHMLSRDISLLDFNQPAREVHNKIRGLSEWPAAHAMLNDKKLKIYKSVVVDDMSGNPGELLDNKRMIIACSEGAVELLTVQLEGFKRMDGKSFLNGRRIEKGNALNKCLN